MNGLASFIDHLSHNQYHPRSDAHSNAFCRGVVRDFIDHCEPIARRIRSGELVAQLNRTVMVNQNEWNTDLVMGSPAGKAAPIDDTELVHWETPSHIEIALEVKGIMTEHGKARKNRLRDLNSFHDYAHRYDRRTIAAGAVVVNVSEYFWSPQRAASNITHHLNISLLGAETVKLFRNILLRRSLEDDAGMEALCVVVIRHDNIRKNPAPPSDAPLSRITELVDREPAPQVGDPLHYAAMIHSVCRAYRERWSGT